MKKFGITSILCFFATISAYSAGGLDLTIKGGLTVPNDEVGMVYNTSEPTLSGNNNQVIANLRESEAGAGYTIGVKLSTAFTDFLTGYAHIGVHQTGEEEFQIYQGIGDSQTELGTMTASQFIVPIGAGAEFHFLEFNILDLYATGQLNLNYLTSDVEIVANQVGNLDEDPSDIRMGYGFGVGSNFDFKLIELNAEILYQALNPILDDDGEDMKSLVSLTVGIVF